MADLHTIAAARLRTANQRYTTNRMAIINALDTASGPLSIPELLAEEPDLAQSSAYRNLAILEQTGVVRRILGNGELVAVSYTHLTLPTICSV